MNPLESKNDGLYDGYCYEESDFFLVKGTGLVA